VIYLRQRPFPLSVMPDIRASAAKAQCLDRTRSSALIIQLAREIAERNASPS
jgi:hypothetical protein